MQFPAYFLELLLLGAFYISVRSDITLRLPGLEDAQAIQWSCTLMLREMFLAKFSLQIISRYIERQLGKEAILGWLQSFLFKAPGIMP